MITPTFAQKSGIIQAEKISVFITADMDFTTEPEAQSETDYDKAICSGFVIKSFGTTQFIATAKHCVQATKGDEEGPTEIRAKTIHYFDGDVGIIKKIAMDDDYDIAILMAHSMRKHTAQAKFNTIESIAEPLFLFGMPSRFFWSYSSAIAMNGNVEVDRKDFGPLIQIECASCYSGNSGGGVFNSVGQVVGIMDVKGPNYSSMIAIKHLIDMLSR